MDCSGYIAWLMYNSIQYGKDSNGYVTTSTNIMQQYYPEWWDCFGKEGRQSVKASTYLYGTKFSWQNPGAVYDLQGLKGKSAEQVLDYIRTMK